MRLFHVIIHNSFDNEELRHMRVVSDQEAKDLVNTGEAGLYAIDVAPIPHSSQLVVNVGKTRYLCTANEISITPLKPIQVGKVLKVPFAVQVNPSSPIASILKQYLEIK